MKNKGFRYWVYRIIDNPVTMRRLSNTMCLLMVIGFVFAVIGSAYTPALAQGNTAQTLTAPKPPTPTSTGTDPVGESGVSTILSMFRKIGDLFISIAYSLMVILFAVGTVKSGLADQAAQQFGATGRVSLEFMNLATGVVIFVVGLISMPLVQWILKEIGTMINPADLKITVPDGFPIGVGQ
jgi:hypothetical protein